MKQSSKNIKRAGVVVLLAFGLSVMPVQALAVSTNIVAETEKVTTLTVSQIQDLAVIYNPTNRVYELNQKKLDLNQMMTSNSIRSARSELDSMEWRADDSALKKIQAQLEELTLEIDEEEGPTEEQAAQMEALNKQLAQAEQQLSTANAALDRQFDAAINSITQLEKTRDNYTEQQNELNKTIADWKIQVRMIAEVLCFQVSQYDQNISVLKDQITLAEKNLKLAEVQKDLGMTLSINVTESQANLANAKQSLATALENQAKVKRQINVLIGRDMNSDLEVVQKTAPVVVNDVPVYSGELVAQFVKVDKTLRNYDKSIQDYRDGVKDTDASDLKQMADYNIEGVRLNIEERKRTIANNVRSLLTKMANDKTTYETSQKTYLVAQKNYQVAKVKHELGLITGTALLQQEISFKNAVLNHWKAQYTYYMDWQDYQQQLAGTDLSTYNSYRM